MANETLMDAISRHRNVRNEPGSQYRGANERLFLDHNRLDRGRRRRSVHGPGVTCFGFPWLPSLTVSEVLDVCTELRAARRSKDSATALVREQRSIFVEWSRSNLGRAVQAAMAEPRGR
jgi:hypothetical protein